jgi:hypothetical protein
MVKPSKLGRNDPCPCGKGAKYKHCCKDRVPWEELLLQGTSARVRHLSLRGKNALFFESIADALQLDDTGPPKSWKAVKRSCTVAAVKKLHQAVVDIWPDVTDLQRVLSAERSAFSGLYVGTYEPESILSGLTRHALYSDRILLVDPFLDARTIRAEFNPIENPEQYRTTTLRNVFLWYALLPWIEAGLVAFVRSPGSFDSGLRHLSFQIERERFASHEDLRVAVEETIEYSAESSGFWLREHLLLSRSDEALTEMYQRFDPSVTDEALRGLLQYVQHLREEDPFFIEPKDPLLRPREELLVSTTGANYEMAKVIAAMSGSHIITDLPSRWREIEIDSAERGVPPGVWTTFSQAFQRVDFRFLNDVPLAAALTLREERRLERMRGFLSKLWRSCGSEKEVTEKEVASLSHELLDSIAEAESEWSAIERRLARWFGLSMAAGVMSVPTAVSTGSGAWLAGGLAVGGITMLLDRKDALTDFRNRYPAAFFLKLRAARGE